MDGLEIFDSDLMMFLATPRTEMLTDKEKKRIVQAGWIFFAKNCLSENFLLFFC